MSEPRYDHLRLTNEQDVLVLSITEPKLRSSDYRLLDGLRQELLAAVALNRPRKVVVDFAQVETIGSGGFRPLISLRRKLQSLGSSLLLSGLRPEVMDVFLVTRLINAQGTSAAPFGHEPDVTAAVARLNGPKGE
jgi:anti-anti-sigma factor